MALYDAMATMSRRTGGAPHARYLGRAAVRREAPGLDAATVIAGLQYPDGRMDDARHTLAVARTAAGYGARVITRAQVVAINRDGSGRVVGVRIRDELTHAEADIAARVVVNAAGVWAAHVQHLAGAMRTVPDPAQRCDEPTALTPCECAPSSPRGSHPCAESPWLGPWSDECSARGWAR